jgi:NitT/TauT family transport system permease protein
MTAQQLSKPATSGSGPPSDAGARRLRDNSTRRMWMIQLARLGVVGAALLAWQMTSVSGLMNPLFMPTPAGTFEALSRSWQDGSLPWNTWVTLEAALGGFTLGMAVGTILGFLIGMSKTVSDILAPFVMILNSMPRIALAPMFILWFGVGQTSAIALVFSLVVFIALTNTIAGTHSVERNLLIIAQLYGASRFQTITKIILPATVPWILAAGRLSLAQALAGAVVAEMFISQEGLGYMISAGSGFFDVAVVFAAIIATLLLAALFDRLGTWLETYLLRWRPKTA